MTSLLPELNRTTEVPGTAPLSAQDVVIIVYSCVFMTVCMTCLIVYWLTQHGIAFRCIAGGCNIFQQGLALIERNVDLL